MTSMVAPQVPRHSRPALAPRGADGRPVANGPLYKMLLSQATPLQRRELVQAGHRQQDDGDEVLRRIRAAARRRPPRGAACRPGRWRRRRRPRSAGSPTRSGRSTRPGADPLAAAARMNDFTAGRLPGSIMATTIRVQPPRKAGQRTTAENAPSSISWWSRRAGVRRRAPRSRGSARRPGSGRPGSPGSGARTGAEKRSRSWRPPRSRCPRCSRRRGSASRGRGPGRRAPGRSRRRSSR